MFKDDKTRPAHVIGPLGEALTLESLPPSDLQRWVPRRKAEVVAAVNGGLLTIEEACARYALSLEEFAMWQRAVERSGMQGLRATRAQHYRDLFAEEQRRAAKTDTPPLRKSELAWFGSDDLERRAPPTPRFGRARPVHERGGDSEAVADMEAAKVVPFPRTRIVRPL